MNYTLGIDPDSDKHGVAIYIDGALVDLVMWSTPAVIDFAAANDCLVAIEDVMANQFIYGRNTVSNRKVQSKIAMSVGRCMQAQYELVQMLEHNGVTVKKFKPRGGNWAKNKALFERVTGWDKRSNEDTRSAAFFGQLALK